MKSFGIFDGVARENDLVAAVIYFQSDYTKIHGGTVDDYKDYLLERLNFLEDLAADEAVRIVHVPFDMKDYEAWRINSPWPDGPEARSAWALEKAKDAVALEKLKNRFPVLPAAPVDEEASTSVLFGVIPAVVACEDDAGTLSARLPDKMLEEIAAEIRKYFADVPPLKRFSPARFQGLKIYVGNRLVSANYAAEVDVEMTTKAEEERPGVILPVPRRYRARRSDFPDDFSAVHFAPVLLPLVFVGASSEVDYCEAVFEEEGQFDSVSEKICKMVNSQGFQAELDGPVIFVPGYAVQDLIQEIFQQLKEAAEMEDVPVIKKSGKQRKSALKRIK